MSSATPAARPPDPAAPRRFTRRSADRRSAVAVLCGAAAFAALQLGLALLLEARFPGAIDPDYGARLALLRRGRRADPERTRTVVVLGSSRVYYGLRPERIEPCLSRELGRPVSVVNFGFAAAGGLNELLTWRRLLHDGVRPDLLLIEVWPQALDERHVVNEMEPGRNPAERLRLLDVPLFRRYHFARPHLRRDVTMAEVDPLYSRRLWLISAVAPPLLPGPPARMAPLTERLAPASLADLSGERLDAFREHARASLVPFVPTLAVGGRGYDATNELLQSCRNAGVPVALLMMPDGPMYRGLCLPATSAAFHDWLNRLSAGYGAPVVNARDWLGEDDFADSIHLLPTGAAKFSERLGREQLLPLLRRQDRDGRIVLTVDKP